MAKGNPRVVPPGAGKTFNVLGDSIRCVLTGADTGGAYAIVEQASDPGSGPPLHMHRREEEAFYVLEGDYEFRMGDQVVRATPGTYLLAPREIPHAFTCMGAEPGRVQVTITPAGFETFFVEVSALAAHGPPDPEKVVALARDYGLDILGPPPVA